MRTLFLLGITLLFIGCEKEIKTAPRLSGSWKMKISMYDNGEQIAQINGNIIFYADNQAKMSIIENEQLEEIDFTWSKQNGYLLLINQNTSFISPYKIETYTLRTISLSQNEDVKMQLVR